MPGEAKQPPRAAVSNRDREDACVLRGGRVDQEEKSGDVQGEILSRLQLSGVPSAERPSKVKAVEEKARGFLCKEGGAMESLVALACTSCKELRVAPPASMSDLSAFVCSGDCP